jgi:F-type H+-transporting ATPase subunit a
MTERILAEGAIEVGHHTTATWLGMTVNTDTVLATAIAAVITIGLAFFLKSKITSTGVPGGVQLFWEAITIQMRGQIEGAIGMKIAPFVLPLAVTFTDVDTDEGPTVLASAPLEAGSPLGELLLDAPGP